MNPYHMATEWMLPSAASVLMVAECRCARNSVTSASDMRMMSRCLVPWPIWGAASEEVSSVMAAV